MEGPLPGEGLPAWWPGFSDEWPELAAGLRGMRAGPRQWDGVRAVLVRLGGALRERRYDDVRDAVQELKAYEPPRTSRVLEGGLEDCPEDVGEVLNEMVREIVPGRRAGVENGGGPLPGGAGGGFEGTR